MVAEGESKVKERINLNTSQENPLVSIVTVVLNGQKYIEKTIKSVLAQTYDHIEYIIIDGNRIMKKADYPLVKPRRKRFEHEFEI